MTNDPSNKAPRVLEIEDWNFQKIKVIEYSAYEKLKAENAELREALRRIAENHGMYLASTLEDIANEALNKAGGGE